MKKILLLFGLTSWFSFMLNAQWTSPGNGTTYTLNDLVEVGCVLHDEANATYNITTDITISATDRLYISVENAPSALFFNEDDLTLTIKGSMVVEGEEEEDLHYYIGMQVNAQHGRIRFEDASEPSRISRCDFTALSGIQIIGSDVIFEDCKMLNFNTFTQSSVVNCLNCSPVFTHCKFFSNEGAAISSPANGQASPQILNCLFFDSVTSNANLPQINLGPGAQDTIRIVNCTIVGLYDRSGGIAIADLMGTGETKILMKDNIVKNNRYGYNQQGKNLSSVIVGNQFIDNNKETNPMNGGSGISIYGFDENNKAVLRNNIITGNLWGITVINAADVNLGTEDDWGHNQIHDNGNGGVVYDLYNNTDRDIMAVGNYWGTTDAQEIEENITHQYDNPDLGLVHYVPFATNEAVEELESAAFKLWPNPAQGRFTVEGRGELTITNALGQLVLTKEIDGMVTVELPRGLYVVRLGATRRKVVVE